MLSKSNLIAAKAIFIGLCLDQFGTIIIGFLASFIFGFYLNVQGYSRDAVHLYAGNQDVHTPYHYFTLLPGLLMSLLSGYVCAKVANSPKYTVSLIFACLDICFAILLSYFFEPDKLLLSSNWNYIGSVFTASFASVMLGARLAMPSIRKPPKLDDF